MIYTHAENEDIWLSPKKLLYQQKIQKGKVKTQNATKILDYTDCWPTKEGQLG